MIHERKLFSADTADTITLSVLHPQKITLEEWGCEWNITQDGAVKHSGLAYGADSIQSFQLALDAARLQISDNFSSFFWNGIPADMSLPETVPISLGENFYRNTVRLIANEVNSFVVRGKP